MPDDFFSIYLRYMPNSCAIAARESNCSESRSFGSHVATPAAKLGTLQRELCIYGAGSRKIVRLGLWVLGSCAMHSVSFSSAPPLARSPLYLCSLRIRWGLEGRLGNSIWVLHKGPSIARVLRNGPWRWSCTRALAPWVLHKGHHHWVLHMAIAGISLASGSPMLACPL